MPFKPRFQTPFRVVHTRRPNREQARHLELVPEPVDEREDPVLREARHAFERLFEPEGA